MSELTELAVPQYLAHVEKRLREENERLLHYLDPSTKWVLTATYCPLLDIGDYWSLANYTMRIEVLVGFVLRLIPFKEYVHVCPYSLKGIKAHIT